MLDHRELSAPKEYLAYREQQVCRETRAFKGYLARREHKVHREARASKERVVRREKAGLKGSLVRRACQEYKAPQVLKELWGYRESQDHRVQAGRRE